MGFSHVGKVIDCVENYVERTGVVVAKGEKGLTLVLQGEVGDVAVGVK
jgi:hypothetical protein